MITDKKTSQDKRVDTRYRTKNVSLPGTITDAKGKDYKIRPVDVSNRGLGFLVNENMPCGKYTLKVGASEIEVEVIYCHNHLGIENLYRAGLFARTPNISLRKQFEELEILLDPVRIATDT